MYNYSKARREAETEYQDAIAEARRIRDETLKAIDDEEQEEAERVAMRGPEELVLDGDEGDDEEAIL